MTVDERALELVDKRKHKFEPKDLQDLSVSFSTLSFDKNQRSQKSIMVKI